MIDPKKEVVGLEGSPPSNDINAQGIGATQDRLTEKQGEFPPRVAPRRPTLLTPSEFMAVIILMAWIAALMHFDVSAPPNVWHN
jgi:hypothetical protein